MKISFGFTKGGMFPHVLIDEHNGISLCGVRTSCELDSIDDDDAICKNCEAVYARLRRRATALATYDTKYETLVLPPSVPSAGISYGKTAYGTAWHIAHEGAALCFVNLTEYAQSIPGGCDLCPNCEKRYTRLLYPSKDGARHKRTEYARQVVRALSVSVLPPDRTRCTPRVEDSSRSPSPDSASVGQD